MTATTITTAAAQVNDRILVEERNGKHHGRSDH
jgi:hypothetical protein